MIKVGFDTYMSILRSKDRFLHQQCSRFIHRCRYKGYVSLDVDEYREIIADAYNQAVNDILLIDQEGVDPDDGE